MSECEVLPQLPQQGRTAQQQWTLWHNRSRSEPRLTEPEWWSGSSQAATGSYRYKKKKKLLHIQQTETNH